MANFTEDLFKMGIAIASAVGVPNPVTILTAIKATYEAGKDGVDLFEHVANHPELTKYQVQEEIDQVNNAEASENNDNMG